MSKAIAIATLLFFALLQQIGSVQAAPADINVHQFCEWTYVYLQFNDLLPGGTWAASETYGLPTRSCWFSTAAFDPSAVRATSGTSSSGSFGGSSGSDFTSSDFGGTGQF